MKKLTLSLLFVLIGMISMSNTNNQIFYVEGKFSSQKCASYEVFQMVDSVGILILKTSCKNKYSVKLVSGIQYVIKFISDDGKVIKYLVVDIQDEGLYTVNVDFKNDDSAILKFDGEAYQISSVNPKMFIKI